MRQPLNPKFASLLGELNPDDYFTLQAIVQHGGLTVEEVGQVLRQPPEVVHMRMERLRQIGLIEDEPECAGMRIAPEAGGVVRDALTRRNLY
jgi:predicted transcriptional regulator